MGTATISDGTGHAFIYEDGTMLDLNNLIAPNSGLTLSLAYAINDEGQIVGMAYNSSGYEQAFLLTPTPEPSTLACLASGAILLAGFCGWRRRHRRVDKNQNQADCDDGPAIPACDAPFSPTKKPFDQRRFVFTALVGCIFSLATSRLYAFETLVVSFSGVAQSGYSDNGTGGEVTCGATVPGFDPSLGTLQSVTLSGTVGYSANAEYGVPVQQGEFPSADFNASSDLLIYDSSVPFPPSTGYGWGFTTSGSTSAPLEWRYSQEVGAIANASWNDPVVFSLGLPLTESGFTYPSDSLLLRCDTYMSANENPDFFNYSVDVAGTVTYTYTSTPVPEPSSFALVAISAIGLAGFGMQWRRCTTRKGSTILVSVPRTPRRDHLRIG